MLIKDILLSYYGTQALYLVSKLKIADLLQQNINNIEILAKKLNVDNDKLYRVLRFLAAKGIFEELPQKKFINNNESLYLLTNNKCSLNSFIKLHAKYFYKSAFNLSDALKEGSIPFEIEYKATVWEYLQTNQKASEVFNNAMSQNSEIHINQLIKTYSFADYKTIVDLGSGIGNFLVAILKKYEDIRGVCLDLPSLTEKANKFLQEQNIADRCTYIPGDFLKEIPQNANLYILKAILHGKNDQLCREVLINCINALSENGKILVIDRVVIKDDKSYIDGCTNDINMLNVSAGKDRTLNEFTKLFKDAGLQIQNIYQIERSLFAIELSK